ncbi:TPR protein [Trifolium pratense]|uniref:TPR protein n=1 Tax=Trifolium pratense TaxID=57577 RepID=A0A2K3P5I9_TRIPR|nr:TPR protein [Trifolium pratense]
MFRIASRISSRTLVALSARPSPISFRSYNTGLALDKNLAVDDVVRMSQYALRQARSEKSVGSYGMGYLVLKHCLSTELTEGNDPKHENSKGIALLAMSTLFSERGDYVDAIEQLNGVQELSNSYLGVRVAAYEAQAGLHLELEQDDMASVVADKCIELVENEKTEDYEALNVRARALKGLTELVKGDINSGNAALSYAELQQTRQNYTVAKEIYQHVLEGASELEKSGNVYLGGGNLNMEGLMMQAMCGLGQLESHLSNFRKAEEHLTKALAKAELIYGETHPKVGVILTSMALMYRRKAIEEKSSSLVVQEVRTL